MSKVELLEASRLYVLIQHPEGRQSNISVKDFAPEGELSHQRKEQPSAEAIYVPLGSNDEKFHWIMTIERSTPQLLPQNESIIPQILFISFRIRTSHSKEEINTIWSKIPLADSSRNTGNLRLAVSEKIKENCQETQLPVYLIQNIFNLPLHGVQ